MIHSMLQAALSSKALLLSLDDAVKFLTPKGFKEGVKHARSGLLFDRSPKGLLRTGKGTLSLMRQPLWMTLPMAAYAAASAPRGQKLNAATSSTAAVALASLPGALLGGTVGALISTAILEPMITAGLQQTISRVGQTAQRTLRPRMGGTYEDTNRAVTMRQRAAQDISTSLLNARQFLGREGTLLHT